MRPVADFWRGKRVLLTGHTGFKGSWLALWLNRLGASVTGVALPADTEPNLFGLARISDRLDSRYCDIRNGTALAAIVHETRPEIIFHLAAQPLVRASYRRPLETLATNVMGTAHLLDSMRGLAGTRVAVMITTDKVYGNAEWCYPYRENDPLGGHDPYSASKAASEIVIASYRDAFLAAQGLAVASARAGNVIGGGDWAEDRLIPDVVRSWQARRPVDIRCPDAYRPWQHVLEPLAGYLALAQRLWEQPQVAGAFNFGPETGDAATVRDVVEMARLAFGYGEVTYGQQLTGPHEAHWLALEIAKARLELGVRPRWPLAVAVSRTIGWYRALAEGGDALTLCESDISAYEGKA